MSHDPFCLAPKCDYDSPDGDCFGYEDCWHRCECILISKVRADERQQAAQRVNECRTDLRGYVDKVAAVAAAKGDQA